MNVRIRISTWADRRTPALKAAYHSIVEQRVAWLWERIFRERVRARVMKRIEARITGEATPSILLRRQAG